MNIHILCSKSKVAQLLLTILTAVLGGSIFKLLQIPVPWLLGPMVFILLFSKFFNAKFYWPGLFRDTGLIILGYSIGLSFTIEVLTKILMQLPLMFVFNTLTLMVCALLAFIVAKISGISFPTALTGSIPGGLTQMVYFAHETKGIDVSIVTFLQVIRLFVIIFSVPLLVFSPLFGAESTFTQTLEQTSAHFSISSNYQELFFYLFAVILFALIGKKIKAPTPFLLGPIIATITLNLTGLQGPELPALIIDTSQLMISVFFGLLLNLDKLKQHRSILWLSLLSGTTLVGATILLSYILQTIYHTTPVTAFLSLAPGGMDQMGIIAHEVKADLSFVAGFQMFRLLFIYFAIPPLLKWLFNRIEKSELKASKASIK